MGVPQGGVYARMPPYVYTSGWSMPVCLPVCTSGWGMPVCDPVYTLGGVYPCVIPVYTLGGVYPAMPRRTMKEGGLYPAMPLRTMRRRFIPRYASQDHEKEGGYLVYAPVPCWVCTPCGTPSLHHPGYTTVLPHPATVQAPRHRRDRLTALRRVVTELYISDELIYRCLSRITRFTVGCC